MVGTPSAAKAQAETTNVYEQEAKLTKLFSELQAGFKKLEGISDPNKQTNALKELTNKMQEAKRCLHYIGCCSQSSQLRHHGSAYAECIAA